MATTTTTYAGATTSVAGANYGSNGRAIATAPGGRTWMIHWDGTSAQFDVRWVSRTGSVTTKGTTTAGATIPFAGSNNAQTPRRSFFIDQDGYAHLLYVDRHNGELHYRRGTPNVAKDGWTWTAAQGIHTGNDFAWRGGDLVAHRTGTGWTVHVVYSWTNSTPVTRCYHRAIAITSAHVITVGAATQLNTADHTGNIDACPTIDFHHTGDGVTIKDSAPHLFVAWNGGDTTSSHGLRYRMATFSGGTWTWSGTTRNLGARNTNNVARWIACLWDGTRAVICSQALDSTGAVVFSVVERDETDTQLASRTLYADVVGTDHNIAGSFTYDYLGNLHFFGRYAATDAMRYRVWDRTTEAWDSSVWSNLGSQVPTANVPFPAVKRGYALSNYLEINYPTGQASPHDLIYWGWSVNVAPNAPSLLSPIGGASFDRSQTQRFSWTFSDPDVGDSQSKYDLWYRSTAVGAAWQTLTGQTPSQFRDVAGNTFLAGDYEWKVRTYDAQGTQGPFSASEFFTAVEPPVGATITAPTNGGTVGQDRYTVTWSVPAQDAYELRRVADSAGSPNTGTVYQLVTATNPTARSALLQFPTNNRYEHVQIRVQKDGLWTGWSSVRIQVSYTPPAEPSVVVTPADVVGIGTPHAYEVEVLDGGGATMTESVDVTVRDPATMEILHVALGADPGMFVWHNPAAGVPYEIQVTAHGTNGTRLVTDWLPVDPIVIHGVILHDPADPTDSLLWLRYNDTGARDTVTVEAALVSYQGRELPVAEFGVGTTRTIEVPTIQIRTKAEADALRALVMRRTNLCYRDRKGRKVFGVIMESAVEDVFYGYTTGVTFHVTEYGGLP